MNVYSVLEHIGWNEVNGDSKHVTVTGKDFLYRLLSWSSFHIGHSVLHQITFSLFVSMCI